jgi:hypothetical protein
MIKRKNIIIGVTALAVVLSTGVIAFAATNSTDVQTGKDRPNIMANLTDAQREAVLQARTDSMKETIAALVDSSTITQDTADKLSEVKSAPKDCTSKGGIGIKALTEEQRTALQAEEKALFESKLAGLIKDGTLTQNQADQLEQGHKMMASANLTDEQMAAVKQAKADAMKEAAANLVEKGSLSQEEADAISIMPKEMPREKGSAAILTEEQRTALGETMKAKFESKLSSLVDDGTITQDQADQLLIDKGGPHMGPGGRHGDDFDGNQM